MARSRSRVQKLIKRQRIRARRGRPGFPRTVGAFLALTLKIFCALVLLSALGVAGVAFYRFARLSDYFELKKIVITGVSDSTAAELRALTQLKPDCGINLLALRTKPLRETILRHPSTKSAKVIKRYPNALVIHATERKPAAITVDAASGALYLIDRDGYVLDTIANVDRKQSKFCFITGVEPDQIVFGQAISTKAVRRAMDLYDCLEMANPKLAEKVSEIKIGSDDGLTLVLEAGVEVRLGTGDYTDRLAALELLMRNRPDFETLEYIDLRFRNQIVFMPRTGGTDGGPQG